MYAFVPVVKPCADPFHDSQAHFTVCTPYTKAVKSNTSSKTCYHASIVCTVINRMTVALRKLGDDQRQREQAPTNFEDAPLSSLKFNTVLSMVMYPTRPPGAPKHTIDLES